MLDPKLYKREISTATGEDPRPRRELILVRGRLSFRLDAPSIGAYTPLTL